MAYKTNKAILDRRKPLEITLELLSFAGGENNVSTDAETKKNEARMIQNWDAISVGGMIRSKGFNEVADGGVTYTDDMDLLIQHQEGSTQEVYGVIEGDLVIKSTSDINQEDAAAFTSGKLCHAVSAGSALWIANDTDNLRRKTIGNAIADAVDQPGAVSPRIYDHKFRLIAEGSGKVVYGSRAGTGNWNAADGFSSANDAWDLTLPDNTYGGISAFPSGNEFTVFTKDKAYALSNFPNTGYRPISNAHGCSAPYSIAKGNEGVFFVSEIPTLGVYLWDGVRFNNLTEFHTFPNDINFSNRIFGIYRDQAYHLFYNKTGSGVSYPNKWRIFHTKWGRWMERPVNADLSDNFGYPALLEFSNSELYAGSSQKDKMYELETTDNSDEGYDTEANYKTKVFTSRDFNTGAGAQFPIDEVRMKLTKFTVTYFGRVGSFSIQWTADRGKSSGSQTIDITADGDLLNDTFTVNTSKLIATPSDATITKSFNNAAVGRRFDFQILQNGASTRPKIKSIKIHAIALEEA